MYLKDPIIYMELHEYINGGFKCIYINLQVIAIMYTVAKQPDKMKALVTFNKQALQPEIHTGLLLLGKKSGSLIGSLR